jgi:hypothetical protein
MTRTNVMNLALKPGLKNVKRLLKVGNKEI